MRSIHINIPLALLTATLIIGCGGGGSSSSYNAKALLVGKTLYEHCSNEPSGTYRKYFHGEQTCTNTDYENNAVDDVDTFPCTYQSNRVSFTGNGGSGYCEITSTTEHSISFACYDTSVPPPVKILETTVWDTLAGAYNHVNPCTKF